MIDKVGGVVEDTVLFAQVMAIWLNVLPCESKKRHLTVAHNFAKC